jgi:hypothetical protein
MDEHGTSSPFLLFKVYSVTGGVCQGDRQKVTPAVREVEEFHGTGQVSPRVTTAVGPPLLFREGPVCAKNGLQVVKFQTFDEYLHREPLANA